MVVIQVRVGDELKNQASLIYESLGMDISTAVRIFLKENGNADMTLKEINEIIKKARIE